MPGILITSLLFTSAWGYLVYTGDISTIWPLFGMANQLLATCALIVGTTMLIRHGKVRYAWTTGAPGIFMIPVTLAAGFQNIFHNYLPKGLWLLVTLSAVLMILMGIVFVEAFLKWFQLLKIKENIADRHGDRVLQVTDE
jgi:carbon starvation protein